MARNSFAGKVRAAVAAKNGQEITADALADALGLITGKEKQPLYGALKDLVDAGDVVRVRDGVYRWANRPEPRQSRAVLYHLLRSRKSLTIDEMVELGGVTRGYASQQARLWVRREMCRKDGDRYVLIVDAGPNAVPVDDEKNDYLRMLRLKAKALAERADQATVACIEIRMAASELMMEVEQCR